MIYVGNNSYGNLDNEGLVNWAVYLLNEAEDYSIKIKQTFCPPMDGLGLTDP